MIVRKVAAVVGAALLLTACAETTAGVAARVGDHAIETSALAERVEQVYSDERFTGQQPREQFQVALLNRLIEERLIAEAARRQGVTVTRDEVTKQVDEVVAQFPTRAEFEAQVAAQGIVLEDVPALVRSQLLRGKIVDKLVEDVPVTEEQLRAQYREQLPNYDNARIAHIVVHDAKLAARVVRSARAGTDFARLAARYSEDPETKDNGGDLGRVGNGEGRFSKAFEKAVFQAQTGDIVGPLRIPIEGAPDVRGYEIVKVVERVTRPFEAVREEVRRLLLRDEQNARFAKLMTDLTSELGVKVNPRFGSWDPRRLEIAPPDVNRLSSPVPVPGEPGVGLPPGVPPAGQVEPGQPQGGQPGQGQPGQGQPQPSP